MAGFRAIKNQMRRDVQEHLLVPAYYRADDQAEWLCVNIRLHTKVDKFGDFPGMDGAQMHDITPKILFMRSEVDKPARNSIISIDTGEAWRVADTLPPDGISVFANVTKIAVEATAGFPVGDHS